MAKRGLPEGAYKLEEGQTYVPYVPPEKVMPEFTVLSVVLGVLLAVVFGAANAYLGLRVGMTISASIPAAVISMGIVRGLLRRKSILENNMVQTIASAGESLAAGAIFTLPALFMWGQNPNPWVMGLITFVGGTLGVLFMVPIRRYLIVGQHGVLPYPEGIACAEVLVAGEEAGTGAYYLTVAGLVGFIYKYLGDGMKLFPTEIEWALPGVKNAAIGIDVLPSLLGVGFIVGPKISSYMFAGAIFGWLMIIPLITFFGESVIVSLFPGTTPLGEMDYWDLWANYLRYIGAGAMLFGGLISLMKELPVMFRSFREAMRGYSARAAERLRTDTDINTTVLIVGIVAMIVLMVLLPQIPVGWLGALLVAVFGFFFVTVSSRLVGMVGSSSNPVSGMTIATVLLAAIVMRATGWSGMAGMVAALAVGAVVCTAAAIAGDISQDLKTGYLVGATPWRQQVGELIGVVASASVIGFTLIILNEAWGFGTAEVPAPQATLMKMIIEGVFSANLPWILVILGMVFAVVLEILQIPILPVAIGLYLPIHLSTPIMVGGLIRGILERVTRKKPEEQKEKIEVGVLYSSGLIAGEAIMGLILALFAYFGIKVALFEEPLWSSWGALGIFAVVVVTLIYYAFRKPRNSEQ
ncbi:MAG TPA: oligopeptide transporter, OPT family [Coprothermobacter sp.]|nr:oligopeptide transporter, OPT family [Coprothermobacter sp.]